MTGTIQGWSAIESSKNIAVPTLIMNGVYDWSDEATAPLFWNITKAKWITFSNASHLLHFEDPERFIKTVGTFLTQD
jgi:pimeloyl-ACP methyl ester carboxylesterase